MAKVYSDEEKMAYVEDFKNSEKSPSQYATENGIPKTTFGGWLKEDEQFGFGEISTRPKSQDVPKVLKKMAVFTNETVRIELKEGFNKEFVLQIVQVLVNAQ